MNLSIVIPAFNEEEFIKETLEKTLKEKQKLLNQTSIKEVEIILVNDGSTDKTKQIAEKFVSKGITLINQKNQGYGAALKNGFKKSKGSLIAFYDADATYPIHFLTKLSKKLLEENAEIIIGSRLRKGTKMPKQRYIGNKLFVYLLRLFGGKVEDTASGMRVFKRELLPKFYSLPNGLEFTPAMTTKAVQEGWNMVYSPIPYSKRKGQSKLSSARHGWKFLFSIVDQVKLYNPLRLFGGIGIIFFILAIALFYPLFFSKIPFNEFGIRRVLFILMFFLIGVNLFFFGFLANFIVKLFFDQLKNAPVYKWAYDRYLLTKYNLIGIFLMVFGTAFIWVSYDLMHWLYPVIGLLTVLTGIQLIASAMIVRILKELYDKKIK